MFKKHSTKRSPNILFVMFRLALSLTMFAILLVGTYSAYKHFSGLDPLKIDPQVILKNALEARTPQQFLGVLSQVKLTEKLSVSTKSTNSKDNISKPVFRFLLVADSHSDNDRLLKAIAQANPIFSDLAFIIGLGDYTEVGTIDELKNAKNVLDSAGLRYFLVAGDHDLWDARDKDQDPAANFREVFGPTYQSFIFNNFKFLLLNNSDNYNGISLEQQNWITDELEQAKQKEVSGVYVFIHEPLYHPSSDHYMGRVEKAVKKQAEGLIFQLKAAGVKKVFSGDVHYFSQYEEPVTKLPMVTIGAITIERNPQVPRFAVVSVFEDGTTKVEDVEIKLLNEL